MFRVKLAIAFVLFTLAARPAAADVCGLGVCWDKKFERATPSGTEDDRRTGAEPGTADEPWGPSWLESRPLGSSAQREALRAYRDGLVAWRRRDLEAAVRHFERARDGLSGAHISLAIAENARGVELFRAGKYQSGLDAIARAAAHDPDNARYAENHQRMRAILQTRIVHAALADGRKPPFAVLWDLYAYNRPIAGGLAPDQNRCALVMSLTLGVAPRRGEASLHDFADPSLRTRIVTRLKGMRLPSPSVADSDVARSYYIRAQELANRLVSAWGAPVSPRSGDARAAIAGKRGIVFFRDAYGDGVTDHIDVWDGARIASLPDAPFEAAASVWFWELR